MKKLTYLLSAILLISTLSNAQSNGKVRKSIFQVQSDEKEMQLMQDAPKSPTGHIRCFTSEMEQIKRFNNPNYITPEQYENWMTQIIQDLAKNPNSKASRNIPVVVHVIHNGDAVGSGENISVAQVNSQITALNQDFSATNTDFGNTPSVFTSIASNFDMQFCLAQTDPSGNPTTGIDRVQLAAASYNGSTAEAMKPGTQWDPTKYFNIWVVNFGSSGLLGYAQFPNSGSANTDGVVIAHNAFGTTGAAAAPYNKGRTATHEIGHCFGLYHIWGDDGNACTGSDQVADTPNQADENYGCPNFATNISCSNGGDMSMNYMDYTNDACMYMFTNGQKARVDAVLASAPRRASLLTSTVCAAAAITADFTANTTSINAGQTVTFTDASTSPNTLNGWTWDFDVANLGGVTPGTASTQGPHVVTYNNPGTYSVSLTVTDNAAGNDAVTKTGYIVVNPVGTVTCDSTAAGWDWNTESFYTGAYWGPDCNGPTVNSGYIMGNNCYDDNGWAAKVTFSGVGKEITDLIYLFDQSTGTGAGALKVWNANGAGGSPNTVLFSYPITTGQFAANLQQLIIVPVSPAVAVSSDFFIGNDHAATPANGDTLCMAIADPGSANQLWANETGGWLDLSAYSVSYKGTVGAVICDISTGISTHNIVTAEVQVQPNPTNGSINVIMPTETNNFEVAVYNIIGEVVTSDKVNSNFTKLDLSNHPNGVYFIKVTSNGTATTKKIVLSK